MRHLAAGAGLACSGVIMGDVPCPGAWRPNCRSGSLVVGAGAVRANPEIGSDKREQMDKNRHMGWRGTALLGGIILGFLVLVTLLSMGPLAALKMLLAGILGLGYFTWSEWRAAQG